MALFLFGRNLCSFGYHGVQVRRLAPSSLFIGVLGRFLDIRAYDLFADKMPLVPSP